MFQLVRKDVILPKHKGQSAIIFLHDTKTAKRNILTSEKVLISEQSGIDCLRALCQRRKSDEKLVDFSPAAFRALWKAVVIHLGLESFNYLPYSLRRGGATSAYAQGMKFDQLLTKAGNMFPLPESTLIKPSRNTQLWSYPLQYPKRVRAASQRFAAELGRVEVGARRT